MLHMRPLGLRPGSVIAVGRPDASAPVERGVAPLPKRREPIMSLEAAQRYAWNLARTLKVSETDQGYNAMPSDDYDGAIEHVVREYDVYAS